MAQPTLTELLQQAWDGKPDRIDPGAALAIANQLSAIVPASPEYRSPTQQAISDLVDYIRSENAA